MAHHYEEPAFPEDMRTFTVTLIGHVMIVSDGRIDLHIPVEDAPLAAAEILDVWRDWLDTDDD